MSAAVEENKQKPQSGSYKWFALLAVVLGTFAAVLNNSLVNVALPKLVAVFGSTTEDIQWVLTGYMLASAVVIPMSGLLGEKYGYRRLFLLSLMLFTVCSFLCGIAWNAGSLIFFRIFQGLSGGFIMPVGMTIIYMIMPREKIGLALGVWGIAAMVAPAIGPTLSGYLIEYFSWRMLFFLNIPVGVFAVVMSGILLRETPKKPETRFDVPGAVLSVIGFGSLLLALSKGPSEGWSSFPIVSLFLVAFFSLALLIWVETGKEEPLMDLRLFKNVEYTVSMIMSGLVMIGMFGGVFLTPIYLQNIQGLSAVQTGLLLMPQSVVMALMMPVSGRLFDRFGVLPLGLLGLSIMGVTTYELHRLAADTPNSWLNMILTIRGLGIGLCMMPLSTVGMTSIPPAMVGKASSMSNLVRQVMASFGLAILTAIMTRQQQVQNQLISERLSVASDTAAQTLQALGAAFSQWGADSATSSGAALSVLAGLIQKEAAVRAIADTFLISAIPIFASIPFLVFFVRKRTPSAMAGKGNPGKAGTGESGELSLADKKSGKEDGANVPELEPVPAK